MTGGYKYFSEFFANIKKRGETRKDNFEMLSLLDEKTFHNSGDALSRKDLLNDAKKALSDADLRPTPKERWLGFINAGLQICDIEFEKYSKLEKTENIIK